MKPASIGISVMLAVALLFWGMPGARASSDGLVAYWPMDEGQGNVIKDKSGNGNDGTIRGGVKWIDGKHGKALEFNGIDSYVDCGNKDSLNISEEITIAAWVKLYSLKGGGIVSKYGGKTGGYFLAPCWRDDGLPYFFIRETKTGATVSIIGNRHKLELNKWYHLVATAKKGDKIKLYIDGVLVGENKAMDKSFSNDIDSLVIGRYSESLNGAIEDIKIYNRVLSGEEIKRNEAQAFPVEKLNQMKQKIQGLMSQVDALLGKHSANGYLINVKNHTLALKTRVDGYADHTEALTLEQINALNISIPQEIFMLGKAINAFKSSRIQGRDAYVFAKQPISNNRIKPDAVFIADETVKKIKIRACPGEYEAASLIICAVHDLNNLLLTPTVLKNTSGGVISQNNIDVRIVKWWYQAGDGIIKTCGKHFIPELILHDDSLVKVDETASDNFVRLAYPEGDKYVRISSDKPLPGIGSRPSLSTFPVKDEPSLMPASISKGRNKQYWLTINVPQNATAGTYKGKIALTANKKAIEPDTIDLEVEVLPIKLLKPYYTSSIYYRGYLSNNGGTISSEEKTKQQLEAELKNMYQHGVTNPTCYQPFDKALLGEYLSIRQKIGMKGPLYYLGFISDRDIYPAAFSTGLQQNKNAQQMLIKRTKELSDFARAYGIDDVYIYGIDEAEGSRLASQREGWQAIHDAGAKIFVAGSKNENISRMGDIQDLLVCFGDLAANESKAWHDKGHKIWSYGNPQGGIEEPETYRRNYGLLLWQNDYDGGCTYAYQNGSVSTMTWNDFESNNGYRHHNMTYPTVDGVIDTIQWEGYREGVDDVRYLTTLINAVESAKVSKDERRVKAAREAEKYLAELKTVDLSTRDLNTVRSEIIRSIISLGK
jgi:hypothetical protein